MGNTEKITEKIAAWVNYPALFLLFLGPYFGMLYQLNAMEKSLPIDPALEIISHSITGAEVFKYDDQTLIKIGTPFTFHFEFNRKLNPSSWHNEKAVFQIEPLSGGGAGLKSIVPDSEDYKKVVLNSVIDQLGEYQLVIAPGAILKTMGGSDLLVSPDLLKEPIKFKIVNDFFAPVLFQPNINNLIVDEKSDQFINYTIDIPKFMKKPNLTADSFVNNAEGNLKVFKVDGIPEWESDTKCKIKIKPFLKESKLKSENLELAIRPEVIFKDLDGNDIPRNSSIIARNVELIRKLDPSPPTYTDLALTGTLNPPAKFPLTDPVKYRLSFNQPISPESLKKQMFSDSKGKNKFNINSIKKVDGTDNQFDIEIPNQEARNIRLALQKVQELKTLNGSPIVLNTDIVSSETVMIPKPILPILVDSIRRNFNEVETDEKVYYDISFNQDVNTDSTKTNSSSVNTDLNTIKNSIYNKDSNTKIDVTDVEHHPENRNCFRVGVKTKGTNGNIQLGVSREKIDFRDSLNNRIKIENDFVEPNPASIIPSLVSNTVTLSPKSKEALVGQDVQYDLIFSNQFGIKPNSLIPKMFDNKIGPKARISNIQPNGKNGFTLNATLDQPGSLQLVLANKSELETMKGTKIGFKNDIEANQNVDFKSESFKGKVILVIVDTKFLRDKNNAAYFDVIATLANQPGPYHPDKPQILTKKGLIPWDAKRLQSVDKDKDSFDSEHDNDFAVAWNLAQKEFENRNNNNPIKPFIIWADDSNIKKFVPNKNDDANPNGLKSNILLHLVSLGNNNALDSMIVKEKLGNSRWLDFKESTAPFVGSLLRQFEIKIK